VATSPVGWPPPLFNQKRVSTRSAVAVAAQPPAAAAAAVLAAATGSMLDSCESTYNASPVVLYMVAYTTECFVVSLKKDL
jgi:hypothetical protein